MRVGKISIVRRFYRRVIFTKTPLRNHYRFKDVFQIFPIDSKTAPSNPYARHFPLFLEYFIDYDDRNGIEVDAITDLIEQQNKEYEIINLLSVLTNHRFFKYQTDKNIWAIMTPNVGFDNLDEEEKRLFNNQRSLWVFGGYMYPDLGQDLQITQFSEPVCPEMIFEAPHYSYFTNNPVEKHDDSIRFPESINSCLDSYFALPSKTIHKVKSCIYLACDGIDISDFKRSLAFLSFISAIEGLVGLEVQDDQIKFACKSCQSIQDSPYKCPNCGRPIWGIKTKLVEFLRKFVAGSEKSAQTYREIYNLRSKMTHQSQLFTGDYDLSMENDKLDLKHSEWLMKLKTLQLFRISLTNWLL